MPCIALPIPQRLGPASELAALCTHAVHSAANSLAARPGLLWRWVRGADPEEALDAGQALTVLGHLNAHIGYLSP